MIADLQCKDYCIAYRYHSYSTLCRLKTRYSKSILTLTMNWILRPRMSVLFYLVVTFPFKKHNKGFQNLESGSQIHALGANLLSIIWHFPCQICVPGIKCFDLPFQNYKFHKSPSMYVPSFCLYKCQVSVIGEHCLQLWYPV